MSYLDTCWPYFTIPSDIRFLRCLEVQQKAKTGRKEGGRRGRKKKIPKKERKKKKVWCFFIICRKKKKELKENEVKKKERWKGVKDIKNRKKECTGTEK